MKRSPDLYAIIGHPVDHSLSPAIHTAFARQTSQALHYTRIDAPPGGFAAALREFLASGGKGLNVTLPFKEEAAGLCHVLATRAKKARAVNTVFVHEDGTLAGDNTDGIGLVRDLRQNRRVTLKNKRVLLLGAGGAARGVLPALLAEKPARIYIANRTPERARKLLERLDSEHVQAGGYDGIGRTTFNLVVNATSASLAGALPPLPRDCLDPGAVCYDLLYADRPTVFMLWAEQEGAAQVFDGWGMLVEQAAESFYLWRGVRPDTAALIATHRA
ncbi:MAG TPA: shikimate dehydrogenase [Gammaproteobacteria bacterium]|nr:shikimate dehydrogenase [Gammaproteobacteria bacterium]